MRARSSQGHGVTVATWDEQGKACQQGPVPLPRPGKAQPGANGAASALGTGHGYGDTPGPDHDIGPQVGLTWALWPNKADLWGAGHRSCHGHTGSGADSPGHWPRVLGRDSQGWSCPHGRDNVWIILKIRFVDYLFVCFTKTVKIFNIIHEFYVKLYTLTFYLSFFFIIGFIIQRILMKTVLLLTGLRKILLAFKSGMYVVQFVYHTSFCRLFQGLWVVLHCLIASWIAIVRLSK